MYTESISPIASPSIALDFYQHKIHQNPPICLNLHGGRPFILCSEGDFGHTRSEEMHHFQLAAPPGVVKTRQQIVVRRHRGQIFLGRHKDQQQNQPSSHTFPTDSPQMPHI